MPDSLSQRLQSSGANQSEPAKLISNGFTTTSNDLSKSPPTPLKSENNKTSSSPITDRFESIKNNLLLNSKDLVAICPILLYQLTAGSSSERAGCISSALVPTDFAKLAAHDNHYVGDLSGGSSDRLLGKFLIDSVGTATAQI